MMQFSFGKYTHLGAGALLLFNCWLIFEGVNDPDPAKTILDSYRVVSKNAFVSTLGKLTLVDSLAEISAELRMSAPIGDRRYFQMFDGAGNHSGYVALVYVDRGVHISRDVVFAVMFSPSKQPTRVFVVGTVPEDLAGVSELLEARVSVEPNRPGEREDRQLPDAQPDAALMASVLDSTLSIIRRYHD